MTDLHAQIMNIVCRVDPGELRDLEPSYAYKLGHRDARHAAAALSNAQTARVEALEDALAWAIKKIDAETCTHEDTCRGGAIWTICRQCDMKWADDRGGFKGYTEPPELTAARALLKEAK